MNLDPVRTYLNDHGWCQGNYKDVDGSRCLAGAVMQSFSTYEPMQVIDDYIQGKYSIATETWNDVPGRTVEDVFNLLDEVEKATQ